MWIGSSCIICGGREFNLYKNGIYGKDIYICKVCQLVFTNLKINQNELFEKYDQDYYAYWITPLQQKRRIRLWERRLEVVKKFIPYGNLLDVGCGEGLFLYIAKKNGYEVYGTEISEYAIKYAKEKFGLNIFYTTLEKSNFTENSFDIITFWHTLEHLTSPDITLEKAYRLIKYGGYLILAVPNVNDIIGQKFYRFLTGRYFQIYASDSKEQHLYHFSYDTLKLLIEKCKFKIKKITADFCEVDPYWRIVEYFSYFISKFLRKKWYLAILAIAQK